MEENEAHLNNLIALEVANSSVSSFTADEKKNQNTGQMLNKPHFHSVTHWHFSNDFGSSIK